LIASRPALIPDPNIPPNLERERNSRLATIRRVKVEESMLTKLPYGWHRRVLSIVHSIVSREVWRREERGNEPESSIPPVINPGTISRVLLTLYGDELLQSGRMRLIGDLDLHVILGRPHIEATHVTKFLDDTSSDETLDRESTEGTTRR